MASVNKIILVGHLGADPETRYFPSGDGVTNCRIATTETWKDKQGEKQEHTEWHRLAFFGKLAEIAQQYLQKGSLIYVEGKVRTRKYTDKDGAEKYSSEIHCDRLQMLGGGDRERAQVPQTGQEKAAAQQPKGGPQFQDMVDDISF